MEQSPALDDKESTWFCVDVEGLWVTTGWIFCRDYKYSKHI